MRRTAAILLVLLNATAARAGVEDEGQAREAIMSALGFCGSTLFGLLLFLLALLAVRGWRKRTGRRGAINNPWK